MYDHCELLCGARRNDDFAALYADAPGIENRLRPKYPVQRCAFPRRVGKQRVSLRERVDAAIQDVGTFRDRFGLLEGAGDDRLHDSK